MTEQVKAAEVEVKPTHVVIDNSNLDAVLADARGEKLPEKPAEKPPEPAEAAPAPKAPETAQDADEDDTGLTAEEKAGLTDKMLRTIGKKHAKQKAAEEFAETQFNEKTLAMKRADALERENARLKEQIAPPKAEENKEPVRESYKTDKEYADAMIDYRVDQKLKAREEAGHKQALTDRQREVVTSFLGRIEKAKEIVPDFEEVMSASDIEVPNDVAGYMQESELGAEIGYHLAKNPQVIERLSKLTPARQLVEIGKIEGTLKPFVEKSAKVDDKSNGLAPSQDGKQVTAPSTNGKPPSKARPEPIQPLETGSASQVEKPASERTYQEERAYWEKTHKVKLTARRRH